MQDPSPGRPSGPAHQTIILAVDDEPAILRLITLVLHEQDYRVLPALSAEAALELIEASGQQPDLAIVDVQLPGMNGLELVRQLQGDGHGHIPVLLISAYGEPAGHQAEAFLSKPFDADDLVEAAQAVLQQS